MEIAIISEELGQVNSIIPRITGIHRVEFINWRGYTICNVLCDGTWRTCSFPITTTIIDFLIAGSLANINGWQVGRIYKNDDDEYYLKQQ